MDALGPAIRLDNDSDMRPIKLFRDWVVDEKDRTVFHRPSKLLFVVDYPEPAGRQAVRPSSITARVAHVCAGGALPAHEKLRRIGKDAIHAFVASADACQEPLENDDIPF
jgi:hypothetical protein